ncbi:MAG TPA: transcriptional regulator [Actinobacteria bacterium]|nr:transcriptional regulator [Actinomycetota bacterium]
MPTCDVKLVDGEKVEKARSALADDDTLLRMAEIFKAISDPSRVKIIYALLTEELCVCDLSMAVRMSQSAVSHQLRSLRNLRLVKYRRAGQMVFYSLDDEHIETLLAQGLQHVQEKR